MSGGVLDADLPGSVERCAYGHDDFCAVDGGHGFVQVVDFDIEERGALADQFGDRADVFVSVGVALVHQFDIALLQHGEGQLVAVGHFGGLLETELFHPELHARFYVFHEKHWSKFLHAHGCVFSSAFGCPRGRL